MTHFPGPADDGSGSMPPPNPTSPIPPPTPPYSPPKDTSGYGYNPPPAAPYQSPVTPPYQPPGHGAQQPTPGMYPPGPGHATNDEKIFVLLSHAGGAGGALLSMGTLGFLCPLIAYLAKGQQSPTIRAHAIAALNFQLLWSIVAFILLFVGWCLFFIPNVIIMIGQIVFGVIAALKANEGELYQYPGSPSFLK